MISGTHSNPIDFPIVNDGFFPDVNLKDFQEMMRIKADLAPELMVRRLTQAVFHVNKALEDFKAAQVLLGYILLVDVPQQSLGAGETEQKELLIHYENAVFNFALGELHPELVSVLRRKEAGDYMESIKENRQDYYNDARDSINLILGITKSKANQGLYSGVIGGEA